MNELWWLLLAMIMLHHAAPQLLVTSSPPETKSQIENVVSPQETSDGLGTSNLLKVNENKLRRGNIAKPSAVTITKTDDPISAFLSRLVIIDPSPYLPPDYHTSKQVGPAEENVIKTEVTAAGQTAKEESVQVTDEKEATTNSREMKKSTIPYRADEGSKEERIAAIGTAFPLGTLIGNGKHRHTVIKTSLTARVSPVDIEVESQVEDLLTKKEAEAANKATEPSPNFRITHQEQIVEASTTPIKSEDTTGNKGGLMFSKAQVVFPPWTSCGHQCLIVGTLAINSGLEWTDALRHPASLGFKEIESKVTRALTAALWQTQFGAFLDFVQVAAFVPGRVDPNVLVDVLLQFSDFNVKPTAHLLFQALLKNLDEGKLPETNFKVDISETYFLARSTGQGAGESCQEEKDNLDVPRWAWLALTGGLTSFGIIAVTGCIVALRRIWRSGPRLSK